MDAGKIPNCLVFACLGSVSNNNVRQWHFLDSPALSLPGLYGTRSQSSSCLACYSSQLVTLLALQVTFTVYSLTRPERVPKHCKKEVKELAKALRGHESSVAWLLGFVLMLQVAAVLLAFALRYTAIQAIREAYADASGDAASAGGSHVIEVLEDDSDTGCERRSAAEYGEFDAKVHPLIRKTSLDHVPELKFPGNTTRSLSHTFSLFPVRRETDAARGELTSTSQPCGLDSMENWKSPGEVRDRYSLENWKYRLQEKYGIDTSNFRFNPESSIYRGIYSDAEEGSESAEATIDWESWYENR